jgi:pimeloyl-ACP methyl ester carboxylesterase
VFGPGAGWIDRTGPGATDRVGAAVRSLSEDLHRRIEGSELIIYPDSGHGGIFQFHDSFAPVAVEFLGR